MRTALLAILVVATIAAGGCSRSTHMASESATPHTPATPTSTRPTLPPATTPPPPTTVTTLPAPIVVTLTNPIDLEYALQQQAQQLMGMNDSSQTDINSFVAWYQGLESNYQRGYSNVQPPSVSAAAYQWISQRFRIQIEAYRFSQAANSVNCMIQNGGPGSCPSN